MTRISVAQIHNTSQFLPIDLAMKLAFRRTTNVPNVHFSNSSENVHVGISPCEWAFQGAPACLIAMFRTSSCWGILQHFWEISGNRHFLATRSLLKSLANISCGHVQFILIPWKSAIDTPSLPSWPLDTFCQSHSIVKAEGFQFELDGYTGKRFLDYQYICCQRISLITYLASFRWKRSIK